MTEAPGVRLADLARELTMPLAELTAQLSDLGIEASGPNPILDEETANSVRSLLAKAPADGKVIHVAPDATVREIATAMDVAPNAAVKKLMDMGQLMGANQKLTQDLAERLAIAFGFTLKIAAPQPVAVATAAVAPAPAAPAAPVAAARPKVVPGNAAPRPPVVTIMGHVDHGKTTLLDTIRKTNVVAGEHGGITQHIGAYQIEIDHNKEKRKITFIDTPGHRAFTKMRARGASITDIVVLVVAANDGIMPQTVEAIQHAQAAQVPMIVAINKTDLPDANPDKVKQQLTEHNLVVEDYGGDIISVPLSARTGEGVDSLLEYILLVADLHELKAVSTGPATGAIIEARTETGRGAVATILVQSGVLQVGDSMVAGSAFGKVRAMTNDRSERLQKAGPATPVEVVGLNAAPEAGETVTVVRNEKEARSLGESRMDTARNSRLEGTIKRRTLADIARTVSLGIVKDLNLIIKADVQGSAEAVLGELARVEENKTEAEVRVVVKLSGVGPISETDVDLAAATGAILIGFNVKADLGAQRAAERAGVELRTYNIIYDLTEDVERAMKGMLTPIYEESALGTAEVRQGFRTPKGITIAGCYVTDGKLVRGAELRLYRGTELLYTGKIDTLRRIKDDVREVAQGFECGVTLHDHNEPYEPGDRLECFEMKQVMRT